MFLVIKSLNLKFLKFKIINVDFGDAAASPKSTFPLQMTYKVKSAPKHAMKVRRGSTVITLFFTLGAGWGWMVNAKLLPFYLRK